MIERHSLHTEFSDPSGTAVKNSFVGRCGRTGKNKLSGLGRLICGKPYSIPNRRHFLLDSASFVNFIQHILNIRIYLEEDVKKIMNGNS